MSESEGNFVGTGDNGTPGPSTSIPEGKPGLTTAPNRDLDTICSYHNCARPNSVSSYRQSLRPRRRKMHDLEQASVRISSSRLGSALSRQESLCKDACRNLQVSSVYCMHSQWRRLMTDAPRSHWSGRRANRAPCAPLADTCRSSSSLALLRRPCCFDGLPCSWSLCHPA